MFLMTRPIALAVKPYKNIGGRKRILQPWIAFGGYIFVLAGRMKVLIDVEIILLTFEVMLTVNGKRFIVNDTYTPTVNELQI